MRTGPDVQMSGQVDVAFQTPEGVRMWTTTLLPDRDTGEGRQVLHLVAKCETNEQVRQLLSLTALRIRAALADLEAST